MADQPPATPPAPIPTDAYPARRPTDSGAIAALVVGLIAPIGALMFFGIGGVILGGVAVFLGFRARRRIKGAGGQVGGSGLALAGWIVGLCALVLGIVLVGVDIYWMVFVGQTSGKHG